METWDGYFARKQQELSLLGSYAGCAFSSPRTVDGIVARKFQLAAALKAQQAHAGWTMTETGWAGLDRHRCGPFELRYGYQRADLEICGPPVHAKLPSLPREQISTVYTASGMSAVFALVSALGRLFRAADIVIPAPGYPETAEAIQCTAPNLRIVPWSSGPWPLSEQGEMRVLLVDFCSCITPVPSGALFSSLDLPILDTSCLAAGSGRIRRLLTSALEAGVPAVLVRSHTKLDSLGIEYGRLGSASFVVPDAAVARPLAWFSALQEEARTGVRLMGAAAVPSHLPWFMADLGLQVLNSRRIAAILHGTRRLARRLCLAGWPVRPYAHGLYLILEAGHSDVDRAKEAAKLLAADLGRQGLPARHAGSFGFDFVAIDSFVEPGGRAGIRLAPSDLPDLAIDALAHAVAHCRDRRAIATAQPIESARAELLRV